MTVQEQERDLERLARERAADRHREEVSRYAPREPPARRGYEAPPARAAACVRVVFLFFFWKRTQHFFLVFFLVFFLYIYFVKIRFVDFVLVFIISISVFLSRTPRCIPSLV